MKQHTEKIAQNLYAISAEKMKPLVVVVDDENNYISHYGNLSNYDFNHFVPGHSCIKELPFLVGLEKESYVVLPLVSFSENIVASVNVIQINRNRYVVLLDAKDEHQRHQKTTQVSNEAKLLNVKLRQITEQLKETQLELEHKNKKLELANTAKSRFISSMSHEFRTPISSILGYADILASKFSDSDDEYRYTKAIERNTKYLLSLIDNVLEHAQLETEKLTLNIAPFQVAELLNDINLMFSTLAKESNLIFNFDISNNVPEVLQTDRIRLQQILINIIGNAIKYTEVGSVSVEVNWKNNNLIIIVSDTGPGIFEEHRDNIFQAFNRIHSENKKGAGLGLSISKQLAEKLGGELKLHSEVGSGSVFTLTIYANQVDAISLAKIKEHSSKNEAKVLIVEDDEDLVELLKIFLHEFGYSTSVAYDGDEAIKKCNEEKFDLVLLDMQLPKLNGTDVLKILVEKDIKIPTIGMTASTNNEDKNNALKAGCNEFLIKPIQVAPLISTINKLLLNDV